MIIDIFVALILVSTLVWYFKKDIKSGLVSMLTFTTFFLPVFPWNTFKIGEISIYIQIFNFLLVILYAIIINKRIKINNLLQKYPFYIFLLVLLSFAYLVSSQDIETGLFKSIFLFVKAFIPIIMFGLLTPLRNRELRLILNMLVLGGVLTAIRLLNADFSEATRQSIDDEFGVLTVGRYIASAMIIVVFNRNGKKTQLFPIVLAIM